MTQECTSNEDLDMALVALRQMVTIAESSLEQIGAGLTLTQFRALRTVVLRTPVTMSRIAAEIGMNPSTVTRACMRLTSANLTQRAPNPLNRREVLLAPTAAGRRVVDEVDQRRRAVLDDALNAMRPAEREALIPLLTRFVTACDKVQPARRD